MLNLVSGLIGSAPRIKEKSYDSIAAALQILQKRSDAPGHYRWAKKVAEAYRLDQSHPLNQALKSARSKGAFSIAGQEPDKIRANFCQGELSSEAFIPYVQKYGAGIVSIEVNEASDDLFECIASNCPNLSTFIFNASLSPCLDLTDKGLESLSRLENLSVLVFSAYHLFNVSEKGLETLFSSSHFSSNLVSLTMINAAFNDACYSFLSRYKQLETLTIKTETLYYKTLSSSPLCNRLIHFSLTVSDRTKDFATDDFLNALPLNLKSLVLGGSFKSVSASGFLTAMKRLSKLEHLSIIGAAIEAHLLKGMKPALKSLHLDDASLLSLENLNDYFKAATELQELFIKNVQTSRLAFPSNLQKLHLHAPKFEDLSCLPITLKELLLEAVEVSSSDFENYFSGAAGLESLSIVNCLSFNRESLESVLKSSADKLTKLVLIGTSVDDIGIVELADFSRLTTLMLADLKAVTKMGIHRFLGDDRVAARMRNLYFYGLFLSSDMTKLFTPFENLRVLYIGNSSAGQDDARLIFENETLQNNPVRCVDWSGPALYATFLNEIK